jgi:hypothetical protein
MEAYRDPSRWAYLDRGGKRIGLCDQCFAAGRFDGLTDEEVADFSESFPGGPAEAADA